MTLCSCKVKLNAEQQLAHGSLVSAAQHHIRADSCSCFLAGLSDLSGNTDYPCCIGPFGKHFDMTDKSLQIGRPVLLAGFPAASDLDFPLQRHILQ